MIITKDYISNKLNQITNNHVNSEDYSFFETNKNLNNIILLGLGGSYAYGTNVKGSDIDIRGICLPTKENILLGKDIEQIVNTNTDTVIYTVQKMVNLLKNCNPNTIEILGNKPENYLYVSDIGKMLIDSKDIFLSKRCIKTFMGYANQQLYKLQQKSLVAMSKEDFNTHIIKTLNFMQDDLKSKYNMNNINFHLNDNDEIIADIHVDNYPVENFSEVLGILNKTIRDYHNKSIRNEKALSHNKINKHAMHLLRLYMMCIDILLYGEINTYREKEHDLLMDVRNGKYTNEDGKPNTIFYDIVSDYEHQITIASEKSNLPNTPDQEKIDKFLIKIYEMAYNF